MNNICKFCEIRSIQSKTINSEPINDPICKLKENNIEIREKINKQILDTDVGSSMVTIRCVLYNTKKWSLCHRYETQT